MPRTSAEMIFVWLRGQQAQTKNRAEHGVGRSDRFFRRAFSATFLAGQNVRQPKYSGVGGAWCCFPFVDPSAGG